MMVCNPRRAPPDGVGRLLREDQLEMQGLSRQAYVERYGHAWNVAEAAQEYVDRTDQESDQRAEAFRAIVGLIPADRDAPIRVLDIGSGQGTAAAVLLDAFLNAHAVGLDVSEPMREIAGKRMAPYGDRFVYHLGDFVDGELPADLTGSFDVALSSRAIHHLPAPKKQLLYKAIFQKLNPNGCFFNLDNAPPSDPFLRARYREAAYAIRGESFDRNAPPANRPPTPGHYWDTVPDHLRFLREAGFESVDCFWRRLAITLIGGYRRA